MLAQNGDFVTHTHTITTLSSGIFGIKSKTINLNQYSGVVSIEGTVDREYEGLIIVNVISILPQGSDSSLTQISTGISATGSSPSGVFVPQVGVYFTPGFTEEFTLENSGQNGMLKIRHLTTNQVLVLEKFSCKKGSPNEDCVQLQDTFSSSNDASFTTSNGDTFYKLEGANSWFFSNGNLFGYFVNNVAEQEIVALTKYLVLPTQQYVKDIIEPHFSDLCVDGNVRLTTLTRSSLVVEKQKLLLKLS
jgi:hypothetical protein